MFILIYYIACALPGYWYRYSATVYYSTIYCSAIVALLYDIYIVYISIHLYMKLREQKPGFGPFLKKVTS